MRLNVQETLVLAPRLDVASYLTAATTSSTCRPCSPHSFHPPSIPNVEYLSHTAAPVTNYTSAAPIWLNVGFPTAPTGPFDFCNVTVTYTHPGDNDTITVTVALPAEDDWNGRFVATGGDGWITGHFTTQLGPLADGYASASTDGGHSESFTTSPASWGLLGPGRVDHAALEDFASRSLGEMVRVGKSVTEQYYGAPPRYSYWAGCSTGGRQGLMVAQRYPKLLDGILAAAPAINWPRFVVGEYWPQQVMNRLGVYPQGCELHAITAAAVEACDGLDGVFDGIISAPGLCGFDPACMVGETVVCGTTGKSITISNAAAEIVRQSWKGASDTSGASLWYGLNQETNLSAGLVGTTCAADGTDCAGSPFTIPVDWIADFVVKDAAFDVSKMSYKQYASIFSKSVHQYSSIIGTDDADLSRFRKNGGKMITWHGLADQLIFPNGTVHYYEAVQALDPKVRDFYRYFEAPGLAHCYGGNGFFPLQSFQALVDWVEKGEAPESLAGTTSTRSDGEVYERPLCVYPLVAKYIGGDAKSADSFECAASYA